MKVRKLWFFYMMFFLVNMDWWDKNTSKAPSGFFVEGDLGNFEHSFKIHLCLKVHFSVRSVYQKQKKSRKVAHKSRHVPLRHQHLFVPCKKADKTSNTQTACEQYLKGASVNISCIMQDFFPES